MILSLRYQPVQEYAGKQAARFLSRELSADIRLESIYVKPFTSLQLKGLYVSDQQGDTLLFASEMDAGFDLTRLFQNRVTLRDIALTDTYFNLHVQAEGQNNLQFLIDYFARPADEERRRIELDLQRVALQNIRFNYLNEQNKTRDSLADHGEPNAGPTVDFDNLSLTGVSGNFTGMDFSGDRTTLRIAGLTLREKSGFRIDRMDSRVVVDQQQIELTGLDLVTNRSHIRHYLLLSYDRFEDFKNFIPKVRVQLELDQARISSADIAFFAPDLYDIVFDTEVSGSLSGTVPEIRGQAVHLKTASGTELAGNLTINGLPDIQNTQFDVQIDRLVSSTADVESLVSELSPREDFDLPDFLDALGTLHFQGNYQGLYHQFQVLGQLDTELGLMDTDLMILLNDQGTHYQGEIISPDFDLGTLVQAEALGKIGVSAYVDGVDFTPDSRELWLDAQVQHVAMLDYRYENLSAHVSLMQNELSGRVTIRDPSLRMDLEGSSSIDPDSIVHDLHADIFHADLARLGWYERDSIVIHGATASSDLKGSNLNNIQGQIALRNLLFASGTDRHHLAFATLEAGGDHQSRQLDLRSEAGDAALEGQIDFGTLGSTLRAFAQQYLPALTGGASSFSGAERRRIPDPGPKQEFHFQVEIKNFGPVAALLSPQLMIAPHSKISGHFSSGKSRADLQLEMPAFRWGPAEVQNIHLRHEATAAAATAEIHTGEITLYGRQAVENLHSRQSLSENRMAYTIQLTDSLQENHAELSGDIDFRADRHLIVHLDPSQILLYGTHWEISESSAEITQNRTRIQQLDLWSGDQQVQIRGLISAHPEEHLDLSFKQFDINTLDPLIANASLNISGSLNGQASIRSLLYRPYAVAALTIEQAHIDHVDMGQLSIHADFDQDLNKINLAIDQNKDQIQQFFVGGTYHLDRTENNLDLLARFDQTELAFLEVILKDLITDVDGTITGQANITGKPRELIINGQGTLQEVAFTVDYLQTPYRANGPVQMENTVFKLDQLALTDPRGRQAQVSGQIDMQRPTNPLIDATIEASNFLVLRTEARHNPLYYGTAYGTGRFRFQGRPDAMDIQINARTDENTIFNIPLNSAGTLTNYEFIRFVSFDQLDQEATDERPAPRTGTGMDGLRMNIDLQVTPGAITNIYTDLGELSGRGEGQISLGITSMGDFEMFGDYLINSGKFTFSAQDFINKIFEIKRGGSIRWTGHPIEAAISLTAFYEQRTSLSPLYDAAGRTANEQRVTARAEMELSGPLTRPLINFGLDFPADPYVKDELQNYLSDANNINQQALSLIVRRSFIPGSTSDFSQELNSTLLSAGTELAFNQLNNLITQSLNLNFIDLNIRSLNDASASLRFFNDRLIFTGGITDLRNQRLHDLTVFSNERIATDAELLYLIRQDGRLVLRASNRLNTRHFLLNPSDEYISALGLIYRREFDNFGEFFRRKK